jgi:hypothetical protein
MIEIFEIIAAAGPFFFFYGMGNGSCSGKLLFRGLTSTDNTTFFTYDSFGLTISSAGGSGTPIDLNEVVIGTGTGITSSFLKVDQTNQALTGMAIINSDKYAAGVLANKNSEADYNSIIIGGSENCIQRSGFPAPAGLIIRAKNSVILGGDSNLLESRTMINPIPGANFYSNVVSGEKNKICNETVFGNQSFFYDSKNNSILGGNSNTIRGYANSVIHSSWNSRISKSCNSLINSSTSSVIICSNDSFISSSKNADVSKAKSSSFISSYMGSARGICYGCYNTVISTSLYGGLGIVRSCQSTILSSFCGSISCACRTNIIASSGSCAIVASLSLPSSLNSSNIIGGCKNCIVSSANNIAYSKLEQGKYSIEESPSQMTRSTIIGGKNNCIMAFPQSTCSIKVQLNYFCNNTILGGDTNTINISENSSIIGGKCGLVVNQSGSSIFGGYKNKICSSYAIGCENNGYVYSENSISCSLSIIGGRYNCFYSGLFLNQNRKFPGSLFSSIIGSDFVCMNRVENTTVIGSRSVQISGGELAGTVSNSTVISSASSCIFSSNLEDRRGGNTIIAGESIRFSDAGVLNSSCPNNSYSMSIASRQTSHRCSNYSTSISTCNSGFFISKGSIIVADCSSRISYSINSVIISSFNGIIEKSSTQDTCNSVMLGSSAKTLTWSNTVLVENLIVRDNTFVATASNPKEFIKNHATGSNGLITSGTVYVRHGLITVI